METVNIKGIEKHKVIQALYNASKPQGMGFLHFTPEDLADEESKEEVEAHTSDGRGQEKIYFDYLRGRIIKCEISTDEIDPWGFDRDNGEGACERAIAPLREEKE